MASICLVRYPLPPSWQHAYYPLASNWLQFWPKICIIGWISAYTWCSFAGGESILNVWQTGSRLSSFYPLKERFSNKQCINQSVFYFTTGDKVNRCSGRTNSLYLIWYGIKIFICRNVGVQTSNAENGLENKQDSAKIGMVGISV